MLTRLIALNHEECVLSIGRVEAGGATNIVPDEVYMEGRCARSTNVNAKSSTAAFAIIAAEIDKRLGGGSPSTSATVIPCVVNDETS